MKLSTIVLGFLLALSPAAFGQQQVSAGVGLAGAVIAGSIVAVTFGVVAEDDDDVQVVTPTPLPPVNPPQPPTTTTTTTATTGTD